MFISFSVYKIYVLQLYVEEHFALNVNSVFLSAMVITIYHRNGNFEAVYKFTHYVKLYVLNLIYRILKDWQHCYPVYMVPSVIRITFICVEYVLTSIHLNLIHLIYLNFEPFQTPYRVSKLETRLRSS